MDQTEDLIMPSIPNEIRCDVCGKLFLNTEECLSEAGSWFFASGIEHDLTDDPDTKQRVAHMTGRGAAVIRIIERPTVCASLECVGKLLANPYWTHRTAEQVMARAVEHHEQSEVRRKDREQLMVTANGENARAALDEMLRLQCAFQDMIEKASGPGDLLTPEFVELAFKLYKAPLHDASTWRCPSELEPT